MKAKQANPRDTDDMAVDDIFI